MKQRDLLIISVSAFILTILWVIFTIYHNLATSTVSNPLSIQVLPIDPNFDTKTIDSLKNRVQVNPLYEISSVNSNFVTPTPTPTASPTPPQDNTNQSSESADLNLVPTETISP